MDRRLIIIPIVLVIGSAVLLSGVLNFSNDDDVPVEIENATTEETEPVYLAVDLNDSVVNESVVENATTPNLGGGMGGGMGGGGLPAAKTVTTTTTSNGTNTTDNTNTTDSNTSDNTNTNNNDTSDNTEEPTVSNGTYTFYIKVENP